MTWLLHTYKFEQDATPDGSERIPLEVEQAVMSLGRLWQLE